MIKNPYLPIPGNLTEVIEESPTIKTFRIVPVEEFTFQAGQFIELTVPGVGEAPFTPSSSPFVKDFLEVTVMKVGRVTKALHELKPGVTLGLRGPFGQPYPLNLFAGKEILIVGGGVGLAPLRALFLTLMAEREKYKKVVFCCGAKTPEDFIYKDSILDKWQREFSEKVCFRITVDQGDEKWKGKVGLVTTTLDGLEREISDLASSISVVCGPPVMMKFTTFKLLEIGYKPENIYLSMEKNMSCGLGKCGHCMMGPYYVCKDGPVFQYSKLKNLPKIWD
ncbi:FAD/NAD(P)-binding protein [Candidatus Calescamantes bacterium]|nr:FAD/NAD(P)-binding protein [Candidatus Calescamantes bacterium]